MFSKTIVLLKYKHNIWWQLWHHVVSHHTLPLLYQFMVRFIVILFWSITFIMPIIVYHISYHAVNHIGHTTLLCITLPVTCDLSLVILEYHSIINVKSPIMYHISYHILPSCIISYHILPSCITSPTTSSHHVSYPITSFHHVSHLLSHPSIMYHISYHILPSCITSPITSFHHVSHLQSYMIYSVRLESLCKIIKYKTYVIWYEYFK